MTAVRYQQLMATAPIEVPGDHSGFWTFDQIATAARVPVAARGNVETYWPGIVQGMQEFNIDTSLVAAGIIGTIRCEAGNFAPVREAYYVGTFEEAERLRQTYYYYPYYGRGFVQLTHLANYAAAGRAIGIDLVNNPDLALDPRYAGRIIAWYFANDSTAAYWAERRNWEQVRVAVLGANTNWGWVQETAEELLTL